MLSRPQISIVVPAYKEEKSIVDNLVKLNGALTRLFDNFEIVCVVDGRLDKTYEKARRLASPTVRIFEYLRNMGKGYAVRFGMSQARGDVVGFIDANDLDPSGLAMLWEHMKWYHADIIIASKRHPVSKVTYPWQRRVFSWGYQMLVRLLFHLNVRDTQVGMKLFRRQVVTKILPRMLVKAYGFDIEMLSVAYYLGFTRIFEAPVELALKFTTSSIASKGFIRTVFLMLRDTLAVFYRLHILHYYDDSNRAKWIKD